MADTGRKRPAEIPTDAEVRAILAQCSRRAPTGIRDRALITVMYRAGLRVSEALALKAADIDATAGTIRVLHGKGDRSRTVGIGDGALAVLQLWLDKRKALGLGGNGRPVFCTLADGRKALSANQVRQMLRRRAAKAGIERRVHPHALRHAHAFGQVQRGVPVTTIQAQLGHAHLSTTDTYLRHIAPADVIALGRSDDWEDVPGPVRRMAERRDSADQPERAQTASAAPVMPSIALEPARPVIERPEPQAPPCAGTGIAGPHRWNDDAYCLACGSTVAEVIED